MHPQQGEDGCEQDGPHDHNRRGAVLPPQQPLQERVEMEDDPDGEEELPKEWPPGLVATVYGIRHTCHDPHKVHNENCCGWNEEGRPLENIQLREFPIFVRCLGCDSEAGIDPRQHLQQPLEHGKEMGRRAPDNPELLIPPPVLDPDSTPSQL